jgi:hypothetical protein
MKCSRQHSPVDAVGLRLHGRPPDPVCAGISIATPARGSEFG